MLNLKYLSCIAGLSIVLCSASIAEHAPRQPAPVQRTASGKSGHNIRLFVLMNVHKDCTSGPLPIIRLIKGPRHGNIRVRRAKAKLTNVGNCLGTQVPAYVVFYKSRPKFAGTDSLELEIRNIETNVVRRQTFRMLITLPGLEL